MLPDKISIAHLYKHSSLTKFVVQTIDLFRFFVKFTLLRRYNLRLHFYRYGEFLISIFRLFE